MKAYKNLGGNSGISSYQIFENAIDIEFVSGRVYTYEKRNIGEVNFAVIKALAEAGAGLCGHISKMRHAYQNGTPVTSKPSRAEVENAIQHASEMITAYRS